MNELHSAIGEEERSELKNLVPRADPQIDLIQNQIWQQIENFYQPLKLQYDDDQSIEGIWLKPQKHPDKLQKYLKPANEAKKEKED